jgi:hypothetical protein
MQIILFDRSIFHGAKFDRLRSSTIVSQVKRGTIRVFFTPMFIEETLLHSLNNRAEFDSQWAFIRSLTVQKWFKYAPEIVSIELGDEITGPAYYLQPRHRIRRAMRNSAKAFDQVFPKEDVERAMLLIERSRQRDDQFRRARVGWRNQLRTKLHLFDAFVDQQADRMIKSVFTNNEPHSPGFLDTWHTKREKCVFTEQMIRSLCATIFLPIADQQLKVDANDTSDSEQLAFLVWADIMVSDDTRFMRHAFDLMYSGSSKQFMTLAEFLTHIDTATAFNKGQTGTRSLDRRR